MMRIAVGPGGVRRVPRSRGAQPAHLPGDVVGGEGDVLDSRAVVILEELVDLPGIARRVGFEQRQRDRTGQALHDYGVHCLPAHDDAFGEHRPEVEHLLVVGHGGQQLPGFEAGCEVVDRAQAGRFLGAGR